jgi:hypothetical protein
LAFSKNSKLTDFLVVLHQLKIENRYVVEVDQMELPIGAHWSPLELEIEKRDLLQVIQMVLTIGANWTPMGSNGKHSLKPCYAHIIFFGNLIKTKL